MIPVYIRTEDEATGAMLGHFDPSGLDSLVEAIQRWGCHTPAKETNDAYGQFFANNNRAGFEVVLV